MRFKVNQEIRVNPRYHKQAWEESRLNVCTIYRIYAVDYSNNQVMFMGVTENWVDAKFLLPLKSLPLKKWLKIMG